MPSIISLILVSILIVIIIYLSIHHYNKYKEGFGTSDINKLTNNINEIGKLTEKIPIDLNSMDEELKKYTTEMITSKFQSVFVQMGDIFEDGLINPLLALFDGIGNVFVQLFHIMEKVGNKIVSLPGCIFIYIIAEIFGILLFFYRWIIPYFIRSFIYGIYEYTIKFIIVFILYIIGYTGAIDWCYEFNVKTQINSIKDGFAKINSEFKNNFGRLDFSKIKV